MVEAVERAVVFHLQRSLILGSNDHVDILHRGWTTNLVKVDETEPEKPCE